MPLPHRRTGEKETIQERRARVWALRVSGASERDIVRALARGDDTHAPVKVSQGTIHRDLLVMMDRIAKEQNHSADQYRTLELERLDRMLVGLWTDARSGRWLAVDRVISIMERRAKLLGLDAPVNVKLDIPVDVLRLLPQVMEALEVLNLDAAQVFNEIVARAARAKAEVGQ